MQALSSSLDAVSEYLPVIRDLAWSAYVGPMTAFAILVAAQPKIAGLSPETVVRTYRAWGPGFGISLGITVFAALGSHFSQRGRFAWGPSAGGDSTELVCWLLFFVVWVSNIKLEVWTLEPLRKLDQKGEILNPEAYFTSSRKLSHHMMFQAIGAIMVQAYFFLS